ncbi:MAG: hypothetical protein Q3961_04195, partial [Bifidobacteriaceae bacterium]|nr:hypothetical protein [Bifidobacteriaceae bacterium]
ENNSIFSVQRNKEKRIHWAWIDIVIKAIGLILSATVYAPAMLICVLITLLCIVIPKQLQQ